MKMNLARWDRAFRMILGFLLTTWAAAGGPWWSWFGVYLLFSASWGLCLIYSIFNLRTLPLDKKRISEVQS